MSLVNDADTASLTEMEKLDFAPFRMNRHFNKCLNDQGELVTEIDILNPEEVYSKWLKEKPTKIILERTYKKMLSSNGQTVINKVRSDQSIASYDVRASLAGMYGVDVPINFQTLMDKELAANASENYFFNQNADGTIIGSATDKEIIFDPAALTMTKRRYTFGELEFERVLRYKETPYLEPEIAITKIYRNLTYSGICVIETIVERYSNYQRSGNWERSAPFAPRDIDTTQNWSKNESIALMVVPNPSQHVVNITLPPNKEAGKITVYILTTSGSTVKKYDELAAGQNVQLDISHLNDGFYFLRTEIDGRRYHGRFVKK